jgi:hypothetical protein
MNIDLRLQLPLEMKAEFIKQLFDYDLESKVSQEFQLLSHCYFRYQGEQCQLALYNNRRCTDATYCDIIDIINSLRYENLARDDLRARIEKSFGLEECDYECVNSVEKNDFANNLIDLALRLWLMMPIGCFRQISFPGTSLEWRQGSLYDAIAAQFTKSRQVKESVTLGKVFNARNLDRIGGLRIIWTNNLADHLRMHDDDTRVSIFHHTTFLIYQKQMRDRIFPQGLVEETLRTLALLLPCHDKKVKKWYRSQNLRFALDENAIKNTPLKTEDRQLDKFEFWHDRLAILKDVFDDAEPNTIAQWWQDRRRRVQWYTFWVAVLVLILTMLFGVIQSIEGGMQVYKTYHPS